MLRYQIPQNTITNHVFYQGSTELMRIAGSGYVGIGTSSPNYALDVLNGNIRVNDNRVDSRAGIYLQTSNLGSLNIQQDLAGVAVFQNFANNSFIFYNSSNGLMTLTPGGSLGILTYPSYPLDINGSLRVNSALSNTQKLIVLYDNSPTDAVATACNFCGFGMSNAMMRCQVPAGNNLGFFGGQTELMRINGLGYVGISNANPLYPLDVAGIARATTVLSATLSNSANLQVGGFISAVNQSNSGNLQVTGTILSATQSNSANLQVGGNIVGVTQSNSGNLNVGGNIVGVTQSNSGNLNVGGLLVSQYMKCGATTANPYSFSLCNSSGSFDLGIAAGPQNYCLDAIAGDITLRTTNINNRLFLCNGSSSPSALCLSNNNIGINNSNPTYPLDVNGTVRINNANTINNKLLVLYDNALSDSVVTGCNFYGLGMSSGMIKYQIPYNGGYHAFFNGPNSVMTIATSNVSIGMNYYNTTPQYPLDVYGSMRATAIISTTFSNSGNLQVSGVAALNSNLYIGANASGLNMGVIGSNQMTIYANNAFVGLVSPLGGVGNAVGINMSTWTGRSSGPPIKIAAVDNANYSSDLVYYTANGDTVATERMRILANGNVGINNSSPAYPLDVNGSVRINSSSASPINKLLALWDGGSTEPVVSASNFFGFGINANILRYQVPLTANHVFYTNLTESMRINGSGNVGINNSTPGYTLDVNGSVHASGDIVALSDGRFKTNIVPISDALNTTCRLNGYVYTRTDVEDLEKKNIGMIAQEVNEILPELVNYDEVNDRFSIKYQNTVALLVEAIKEMRKEYKNEISQLKEEIRIMQNQ